MEQTPSAGGLDPESDPSFSPDTWILGLTPHPARMSGSLSQTPPPARTPGSLTQMPPASPISEDHQSFQGLGPWRSAHPTRGHPADGSQHSDTGSPPANPDCGFPVSTSDLCRPLGACRRPRAAASWVLFRMPGACGGARYSPLGTWCGRAAGRLCSGPGGAGFARTRRSPRGRGRSGVSHPAPPRPRPPVR